MMRRLIQRTSVEVRFAALWLAAFLGLLVAYSLIFAGLGFGGAAPALASLITVGLCLGTRPNYDRGGQS